MARLPRRDPPADDRLVVMRCTQSGTNYLLWFRRADAEGATRWEYGNPTAISATRAEHGGYGLSQMQGHFAPAPDYSGCPDCQAIGWVVCGSCNRMSCNRDLTAQHCPWCGTWLSEFEDATRLDGSMDI